MHALAETNTALTYASALSPRDVKLRYSATSFSSKASTAPLWGKGGAVKVAGWSVRPPAELATPAQRGEVPACLFGGVATSDAPSPLPTRLGRPGSHREILHHHLTRRPAKGCFFAQGHDEPLRLACRQPEQGSLIDGLWPAQSGSQQRVCAGEAHRLSRCQSRPLGLILHKASLER